MNLDSNCKHCHVRIFNQVRPDKRHYSAPKPVREAWKDCFGGWILGKFYKARCEVCHRNMAVFDNPKGELAGNVVVLYLCTFTDEPATEKCDEYKSCMGCPMPRKQKEANVRKYY